MQSLAALIDMIAKGRNLHICILDLCGVLSTPETKLPYANIIHSKQFCNIAKATDKGYRLCVKCKAIANAKAIKDRAPFSGHCLCGLYEAAVPLTLNGAVAAVVYVGNAITDESVTRERIQKICRSTAADLDKLYAQLDNCERLSTPDELISIGEIVCDYLKMLYEKAPRQQHRYHWLVNALKRHADEDYCTPLTLKELASWYNKNEKYIGRLWKREMGISFHEYCLNLRLAKAVALLCQTDSKVLDVALECGFNNISYFNRAFMKKYGMPPTAYRKQ